MLSATTALNAPRATHSIVLVLLALDFGGVRSDGSSAFSFQDGSKLHGHFFGQSSFSRLAVAQHNSIVKLPDDACLELFAPLGCGLQTGAGSILNTLNVQPGSTVAIFGVGSVGLSAIMAARIRQAKEIIAVDIQPSRFELAKELGTISTINRAKTNDFGGDQKDLSSYRRELCLRLFRDTKSH